MFIVGIIWNTNMNTICEQNTELLSVIITGKYSTHCALKCSDLPWLLPLIILPGHLATECRSVCVSSVVAITKQRLLPPVLTGGLCGADACFL
jgi:hypothetical protein